MTDQTKLTICCVLAAVVIVWMFIRAVEDVRVERRDELGIERCGE